MARRKKEENLEKEQVDEDDVKPGKMPVLDECAFADIQDFFTSDTLDDLEFIR